MKNFSITAILKAIKEFKPVTKIVLFICIAAVTAVWIVFGAK